MQLERLQINNKVGYKNKKGNGTKNESVTFLILYSADCREREQAFIPVIAMVFLHPE